MIWRAIASIFLLSLTAALGASGFAMAADVNLADPTPGGEGERGNLPGGMDKREAGDGDVPKEDLAGQKSQMFGEVASATNVRDAGLEAEDFDPNVTFFNKFKYASETVLTVKVKPIKVSSYVVQNFRFGQPNLDAVIDGLEAPIVASNNTFTIPLDKVINHDVLTPNVTFQVKELMGYWKDKGGNYIEDGSLQCIVLQKTPTNIVVKAQNLYGKTEVKFEASKTYNLVTCATAGSESQMSVDPISFLPTIGTSTLQKKIATTIITDAFSEQSKKTPITKQDVIRYVTDVFKRQVARTHLLGTEGREDVRTAKGNREAAYTERGLIRQIPGLYTHGEELDNDDLLAISSMMFTEFAQSDKATAFVGKREMKRLMKLVNSAVQYKDVATVTVDDYGIKIRKYTDNFGQIEFIYDQTLDELGYSDYMIVLDLSSIVRYYMRDDKVQTLDLKKTGDRMEAEEWSISRIDCYHIKGGNHLIVCPYSVSAQATKLGGITAQFKKSTGSESGLDQLTKGTKYYLTADLGGFKAGQIITYDADLDAWDVFEGRFFV